MCPDWESNQWPFGSQAGAQSTEPHQPGHNLKIFKRFKILPRWGVQAELFFKKEFIYLFLERGEGRETKGENHQCVVVSPVPPTGKSNQWPFGSQAGTQSTEPHQVGEAELFVAYLSLPLFSQISRTLFGPHKSEMKEQVFFWSSPAWLSWLGIILQSKRSPVRFLGRAHSRVVGQSPVGAHVRGNWWMFLSHIDVSLPLFPSPPLSKIKWLKSV